MRRVRSLMVVLVALSAVSAWGAPAVILFPSIGTTTSVTVAGRVLKDAPSPGTSAMSRNLRRLSASNWEGAPVEVRFAGLSASVVSVSDGAFSVTFSGPKPFPVGVQYAEAYVRGARLAVATVDVGAPAAPYFVISDFDDTIAVSNVVSNRGLLNTALMHDGTTHPPVEGMNRWYRCMRNVGFARPVFALVSGSPQQFTGRIGAFLQKHGMPPFGLYLRDLGPSTLSDYKQPVIRKLLEAVPYPVVLVGDSGEHDPEVYAQIRKEYPDRVKAIYIHDVGRAEDAARFEGMVLFKEPKDAAADSVTRGLAQATCVDAWEAP
ncbi:MAG: DUF2183 domain-containing protein [Archangium sp.]|nr:DUF2183 domain-containing protein [Archangium sp.]